MSHMLSFVSWSQSNASGVVRAGGYVPLDVIVGRSGPVMLLTRRVAVTQPPSADWITWPTYFSSMRWEPLETRSTFMRVTLTVEPLGLRKTELPLRRASSGENQA